VQSFAPFLVMSISSNVSHKSPRVQALVAGCHHPVWDRRYAGYFACFNAQLYYEAHDVLEDLWLAEGKSGANHAFYKGLIQAAGAFVHMKLHHAEPHHRVHGQRLAPAARLLQLAVKNTHAYGSRHQDLDLATFHALCHLYLHALEDRPSHNPWSPDTPPHLLWPS
jgi:predicted metal-dependent hydrolase